MVSRSRIEFGDWQTPDELAHDVVQQALAHVRHTPRTILEPTCGAGAFLVAAAQLLPACRLVGYEINPEYAATAEKRTNNRDRSIHTADFFSVDWEREIGNLADPLLVVGNPPWVTNAGLGAIEATNLPPKQNFKGARGLDALTGKSNFDVSEWMILRLLRALAGRNATLAMLCKSAVARRVVEWCAKQDCHIFPGGVWRIDAKKHFHAAVDAVLFMCHTVSYGHDQPPGWPVFSALNANSPESTFGIADGQPIANLDAYHRSRIIAGTSDPEWRSGIKHDCAPVMELMQHGDTWNNGLGIAVDIEPQFRFPLLKSSDLANGHVPSSRAVIVPQRALNDDTRALQISAPKLWAYLTEHANVLNARKSAIYKGKPPFAIFGVGEYSFAPWKVAISGLYKHLRFCIVGPHEQKPVMLDDTCYFLPFSKETDARRAARALESNLAQDYFRGRIFWDAKRPISKAILQALDLERLCTTLEPL